MLGLTREPDFESKVILISKIITKQTSFFIFKL